MTLLNTAQAIAPNPISTPDEQYIVAENRYIPVYKPAGDGFCVSFVQSHGYSQYHGDAYEWRKYINSRIPIAGSVVVLDEGPIGHLALVTEITDDSITIVEQNFYGRYIIDYRTLPRGAEQIEGYIF